MVFEVAVENQVAVRNRYDLIPLSVGVFFCLVVLSWEVDPRVVLTSDTLVASVVFGLDFSCLKLWVS